jgi:hypothetical protein
MSSKIKPRIQRQKKCYFIELQQRKQQNNKPIIPNRTFEDFFAKGKIAPRIMAMIAGLYHIKG